MKHITLLFIISLFYSSQASAWTKNLDFEQLSDGERKGIGFSPKQLTNASTKYARSGKVSVEMGIPGGTTGFDQWGGTMRLQPKAFPNAKPMTEGSEVWYRIWYYFPTSFDFSATGSGLKLSRVHTSTPGGGHEGYHTVNIKNGLNMESGVTKDFASNWLPKERSVGQMIPTGQWHAVEQYIRFSSVPGRGIRRVWQNGKLVFNDTVTITLRNSASKGNMLYFFTYWNGDSPKAQVCYIDDMVVTTDTPSARDSQGNPFIGIGNVVFTSPPDPPGNIQ